MHLSVVKKSRIQKSKAGWGVETAHQSVYRLPKVPPFMAVAYALSEVLNNNHRNDNDTYMDDVHEDLYHMSICNLGGGYGGCYFYCCQSQFQF